MTHRGKTVQAKDGSDGAESYSGKGDGLQEEEGDAPKEEQEAGEDGFVFETETEIETETD